MSSLEPGFLDSLRALLPRRERRCLERAQRAAVLVPIVGPADRLALLLTRRTEGLPTHAGQVAFPGGLVHAGEGDPARTALREAEEEIGLPPASVEVLGLLDDFTTLSDALAVTPVVGRVERLPRLEPRSEEVARVFTIPIADLRRAERWTSRLEARAGRREEVPHFEHDGEKLWGLSARIVLHLLALARADDGGVREGGGGAC